MATFAEEFRSVVQEFRLVLVSNLVLVYNRYRYRYRYIDIYRYIYIYICSMLFNAVGRPGNRAPPFPPGYSNFFINNNNKKFEKHGFI